MVRLGTDVRVDGFPQDFFGSFLRHLLDFHAAFRGGHEDDAPAAAVDDGAEIELPLDADALFNVDPAYRLPPGIGLRRDQAAADPAFGESPYLVR